MLKNTSGGVKAENDFDGFMPPIDPFRASYADPLLFDQDYVAPMEGSTPFNGRAPNLIGTDVTTVPPMAGLAPNGNVIPVQNIESDLRELRAEMPFLPIVKAIPIVRTAFVAVAGTATDFQVPTGCALVRFEANGDFLVSFGGKAIVPTAASLDLNDNAVLLNPRGEWYYTGGVMQVSVTALNNNTIVQARFIGRANTMRAS